MSPVSHVRTKFRWPASICEQKGCPSTDDFPTSLSNTITLFVSFLDPTSVLLWSLPFFPLCLFIMLFHAIFFLHLCFYVSLNFTQRPLPTQTDLRWESADCSNCWNHLYRRPIYVRYNFRPFPSRYSLVCVGDTHSQQSFCGTQQLGAVCLDHPLVPNVVGNCINYSISSVIRS